MEKDEDMVEQEQAIRKDFFISYTGADRQWAEWIAWQLERANFTTTLEAWDSHAGSNSVLDRNTAITQATRMLAILSPDYLASEDTSSEWATAFNQDPTGKLGTLVPVRVRPCDVKGLLGQIVYIDLVGQDEPTAREHLLGWLNRQRHKPTHAPAFPASSAPTFPGTLPPYWNIPYQPNPYFTGREGILLRLATVLRTRRRVAIGQP